MMRQLNSEQQNRQTQRAWRSPMRFLVFLPAVQKDPDLHSVGSNCTGNLLQHPQDPSPSDFST